MRFNFDSDYFCTTLINLSTLVPATGHREDILNAPVVIYNICVYLRMIFILKVHYYSNNWMLFYLQVYQSISVCWSSFIGFYNISLVLQNRMSLVRPHRSIVSYFSGIRVIIINTYSYQLDEMIAFTFFGNYDQPFSELRSFSYDLAEELQFGNFSSFIFILY